MKARNSNLELLRILSMFMIVFIHANMYLGRFCQDAATGTFFNGLVNGICNIGVTCFILISGYFGIQFNWAKLIKMECMMIFFSLLETMLLCLFFPAEMSGTALLEALVKSCFPVITRKYWFYSCYVVLLLLSRWLHMFLEQLNEKSLRNFLLLLLVLFSLFPTFFYFEIIPDNGKGLVQMIMIYLIGRYIAKYRDRLPFSPMKAAVLFGFLWLLNGLSHEIPLRIGGIYHHLCKDNSITNIMMAVLLFYFMKHIRLNARPVNQAAAFLFAVFALNNSMVKIVMHVIEEKQLLPIENSIVGFLILAAIVFLILISGLIIGGVRELIFGRLDHKIAQTITQVAANKREKR